MVLTRKLFVGIILLFLSGCAVQEAGRSMPENQGLDGIDIPVKFFSQAKSALSEDYYKKRIVVLMPTIPGAIFGRPTGESIYSGQIAEDRILRVSLREREGLASRDARPIGKEVAGSGLKVAPLETRFLRIGTFAFNQETTESLGDIGFLDNSSKENLILIYVDRACRFTGTVVLGYERFEHDVDLPGGGFYLMRLNKVGDRSYRLDRFDGLENVQFSITVKDMEKI